MVLASFVMHTILLLVYHGTVFVEVDSRGYNLSPKYSTVYLCIKTESVTVGADSTVYVWFLCQILYMLYRFICSSRDRLGFYVKIQIIFWTVCCLRHF